MSEFATTGQQAVQVTSQEAAGAPVAVRAQAEVQAAILVAKAHPRDELAAFSALMKASGRPGFAAKARYSFPRGGTKVKGASVNLAREAARCWGNIRYGHTIIPTEEADYVQIEAWAHDAQTNSWAYAQDRFRNAIQRKDRHTGETKWVTADERDLRELVNKRAALCTRNCLLQILPFDLIEEAEGVCEDTKNSAARGDLEDNREDTVRKLLATFDKEFAVSQAMIEAKLGHTVANLDAAELTEFKEIFHSIKDGVTTRDSHFDVAGGVDDAGVADDLNAEIDKGKKKAPNKKKPAKGAQGELI